MRATNSALGLVNLSSITAHARPFLLSRPRADDPPRDADRNSPAGRSAAQRSAACSQACVPLAFSRELKHARVGKKAVGTTVEMKSEAPRVGRAENEKCRDASETEGKSRKCGCCRCRLPFALYFRSQLARLYRARCEGAKASCGGKRVR